MEDVAIGDHSSPPDCDITSSHSRIFDLLFMFMVLFIFCAKSHMDYYILPITTYYVMPLVSTRSRGMCQFVCIPITVKHLLLFV